MVTDDDLREALDLREDWLMEWQWIDNKDGVVEMALNGMLNHASTHLENAEH